MLIKG